MASSSDHNPIPDQLDIEWVQRVTHQVEIESLQERNEATRRTSDEWFRRYMDATYALERYRRNFAEGFLTVGMVMILVWLAYGTFLMYAVWRHGGFPR